MNVFKLLSRSSNAAQSSPAQKLPSSGAVANPQLFGHDEAAQAPHESNTNRKRKRGQGIVALASPSSSAVLPAALDFFGGGARDTEGNEDASSKKERRKQREQERKEEVGLEKKNTDTVHEEPYNLNESKRILHSHKLKVAVLEDFAPQLDEPRSENKSKKRKKEKEKEKEIKDKNKNAKKPLYPRPLTAFAQLRTRYNISTRLAQNIMDQGYNLPTEVQLAALPLLLRNNGHEETDSLSENGSLSGAEYNGDIHLLTVAPTGSGKTIAFLIPIINALLAEGKPSGAKRGPRAVVLAPTRELASQIVNEARKLAKGTAIKATLMRKGMQVVDAAEKAAHDNAPHSPETSENEEDDAGSVDEEEAAPRKKQAGRQAEQVKAAILVATPLALLNALKCKDSTVANLPTVSQLVLDEADVLLDPLFREQTLAIWHACTNPKLRLGLWSATMGSNIESLTISTLNDRWATLSSSQSDMPSPPPPLIRLVVGLKDSAIPNISHQLTYAATEQGKLLGLRQLLHPTSVSNTWNQPTLRPPFLVFTQTIPRAIALHSELLYDIPPEAGGSSRIAVLHADLSSSARDSIMTRFRKGEIWVLITTDLLARGVDFRGLNGVVNYDVPTSAAGYVHRVGRTGRAGREGGVAVTFYTQDDIPYVKLIANVIRASEKLRGVAVDEGCVKQWLLDALPTPSKRDRQQLKKRGVEARRQVKGKSGRPENRISSKSGYDRRVENMKKGAKMAARKRRSEVDGHEGVSEFEGFD
ncbi:P-loop containing nucleoside triphosphate hydrolase protein [Decorospora gaudefroyi]|uniref:ATP-dependent RNA helicase n=1 Tax=Decorospora gaudefroyi TaxID=184978 RepID=A0A6A5K9A5_9PLEO|nr:P-loop containing nucleoside triphosphate hydrolase protein [Decorospora gaudefroyi]